ncbi:MAG: M20/M25/M40 family metallo-hydrolase, partial [Verrucomicrobiota bacterium]
MGLSPDESAILSQIPPKLPALTEELITWANQPSGSADTEGLARMSGLLRTSFGEIAGEEPEKVPLPKGSVPALRWRIRPEASTRVFLGGHFDTVYPRDHPFQTCTRLSPDRLRGPGVADMKGGLLVLREALRLFEQSSSATSLGWELLLTPDEETGSLGSAPLLEEAAKRNHFGIVVEPALPSGAVTRERLGSATYHLLANGQAAHVGRCFDQGRNAITTLYISALNELNNLSSLDLQNNSIQDISSIQKLPKLSS